MKVIMHDGSVAEFTFEDEIGRNALRHTASHILAQAVKRLFPETKLAIGPAIKDGFYYDFDRDEPFTDEDLVKALEIWQSLFTEGVFQDGAVGVNMYTDTTDLWNYGEAALCLNGSWAAGQYVSNDPEAHEVFNHEGADLFFFHCSSPENKLTDNRLSCYRLYLSYIVILCHFTGYCQNTFWDKAYHLTSKKGRNEPNTNIAKITNRILHRVSCGHEKEATQKPSDGSGGLSFLRGNYFRDTVPSEQTTLVAGTLEFQPYPLEITCHCCMVPSKVMEVRPRQSLNADCPMLVTPSGMVMDARLVQP